MVKILYEENKQQRYLSIKGHAEAQNTDDGSIICSACSMITYLMAQNISDMSASGIVDIVSIKLESGDAELIFKAKKGHEATVDIVINAIFRGYELLAAQYEKIFSITYKGWGEINFPFC